MSPTAADGNEMKVDDFIAASVKVLGVKNAIEAKQGRVQKFGERVSAEELEGWRRSLAEAELVFGHMRDSAKHAMAQVKTVEQYEAEPAVTSPTGQDGRAIGVPNFLPVKNYY